MIKKEKPKTVNITPLLKKFVKKGTEILGERYDKFYSEGEVLVYYLSQNYEFMVDYNDYCIKKGLVNDLLIRELEENKRILDYFERISLRILV